MFGKSYALGACLIGLLKIFWGIERLQHPGRIFIESGSLNSLMRPLDLLWNLVSLLAIFLFLRGKKPWLSPVSFVLYSVIMTLFEGVVPSLAAVVEMFANLQSSFARDLSVVDIADGVVGILFGIYYAIINIWFWRKLIAENKS